MNLSDAPSPNAGFPATGIMDWKFLDPPVWNPDLDDYVIADRYLPDGTYQLMVRGSISTRVEEAQVVGLDDYINAIARPAVHALYADVTAEIALRAPRN